MFDNEDNCNHIRVGCAARYPRGVDDQTQQRERRNSDEQAWTASADTQQQQPHGKDVIDGLDLLMEALS